MSWGVALLAAGGGSLAVGLAARAVASRATLSEDEARGSRRLMVTLYVGGALLLVAGLIGVSLG